MNRIGRVGLGLVLVVSTWNTVGRAQEAPPAATIDASKDGPAINPFIYGQFIEHLGRCIYGGIWAEMLEDRKFYFPVTDEYRPYRDPEESEFPVVGASPWEVVGPAGSVTMVSEDAFVGEHTPRVAVGSGIRQNDLGLVAGKDYAGYIWFRPTQGTASLKITLAWGDGPSDNESMMITAASNEYMKHPFRFKAGASTNKGRLSVEVRSAPTLIGTLSLMPGDNVRGMRRDTLALLKELNGTMYRWPGGNFVSGYDWRDGIGDRDRRPPRKNPAWTGVEHNDVGIDEFIAFCREVGAEPIVTVNTGFGDHYSAAQEVEYANGSADTIGGSWRVKNGHAEPYGVRYWCVGNEMWGNWQLGYMQVGQYTQKHNLVAKAMLKADPRLKLVASGSLDTQTGGRRGGGGGGEGGRGRGGRGQSTWSGVMLSQSGGNMDLIAEHFYENNQIDDIPQHVAEVVNSIRGKAEGHRQLQANIANLQGRTIPIAMTEWNYWFRPYVYGELGCVYQLRDALGIAAGLHEYYRNSDIIHMAHYAQTVNVIGCIKTTKTDAFFEPTALPLLLYRREYGTTPLAVSLTNRESLAGIDVAAAKTADGKAITIGAVNPYDSAQAVRLNVDGARLARTATVWRIAGSDPKAINTASDKENVRIREEKDVPLGAEITLPAYSVSLYRVAVE
jgi:alpha-N-arabinofuranosidase